MKNTQYVYASFRFTHSHLPRTVRTVWTENIIPLYCQIRIVATIHYGYIYLNPYRYVLIYLLYTCVPARSCSPYFPICIFTYYVSRITIFLPVLEFHICYDSLRYASRYSIFILLPYIHISTFHYVSNSTLYNDSRMVLYNCLCFRFIFPAYFHFILVRFLGVRAATTGCDVCCILMGSFFFPLFSFFS